jgi:hypothetical protein
MNSNQPVPLSLKIVAGLFIFEGACTAIGLLVSLWHGRLNFALPGDLSLLGLFIGPGLLRFSRGWRTCALVLLSITLVGAPIVVLLFLILQVPINFSVLGLEAGLASTGTVLALAALAFVLTLWEYWVLTRPNVRVLFDQEEDQPSTSPDDPGSRP